MNNFSLSKELLDGKWILTLIICVIGVLSSFVELFHNITFKSSSFIHIINNPFIMVLDCCWNRLVWRISQKESHSFSTHLTYHIIYLTSNLFDVIVSFAQTTHSIAFIGMMDGFLPFTSILIRSYDDDEYSRRSIPTF